MKVKSAWKIYLSANYDRNCLYSTKPHLVDRTVEKFKDNANYFNPAKHNLDIPGQ